jgi:bacterioferritin-associated ferredoxin
VGKNQKKITQIICFCNNISKEAIEAAIKDGAVTLNEIYDKTTAGVGPCGGSCRRRIGPMLEKYLETGKFEEEPGANVPAPHRKFQE